MPLKALLQQEVDKSQEIEEYCSNNEILSIFTFVI